jgi:hypothetical protein
MCRPSCCTPGNEGAGIAAVAVIAGGAFAYAKIGPAVVKILHLAAEVLMVFTLTAVAALACILATWTAARIIGTRRAHRQVPRIIPSAERQAIGQPGSTHGCLACGGSGIVIRAIGPARDQVSDCPACQPVHKAG